MKTREFNDLPKIERIRCFASAPRASAATITKLEDGDFRTYWISRLCGRNVRASGGGRYLFDSREEAVKNARRFRDLARRELQKMEGE